MQSPEKLATFLLSAAKGEIEEVPPAIRTALKVFLTAKRNLIAEIQKAKPEDVDNAMLEVAKLALSIRSDDATPFTVTDANEARAALS